MARCRSFHKSRQFAGPRATQGASLARSLEAALRAQGAAFGVFDYTERDCRAVNAGAAESSENQEINGC